MTLEDRLTRLLECIDRLIARIQELEDRLTGDTP